MASELFIGLMSGTSLDGVDAVLADFSERLLVVSTHYAPFAEGLRSELKALLRPGADELARSALLRRDLAARYAQAVRDVLNNAGREPKAVAAIGCHGQTVRHQPELGYTIQLVDGALLAEETGITVVCDFRSRDVAAGGQGAPLVPAFHAAMFRDPARARVVVNLGGIANLTWLPTEGPVSGFDCGPANALLDEWAEQHLGAAYDAGGNWAAGGTIIPELLSALSSDPYFSRRPPKSTGREYFDLRWAGTHFQSHYHPRDIQATFSELSARALVTAVENHCPGTTEILLCGGGVANTDLVSRIRRLLGRRQVDSTARLGMDPDWVEALAFAWLARETLAGRPGNLPEVTGARGPRVLGSIYPA